MTRRVWCNEDGEKQKNVVENVTEGGKSKESTLELQEEARRDEAQRVREVKGKVKVKVNVKSMTMGKEIVLIGSQRRLWASSAPTDYRLHQRDRARIVAPALLQGGFEGGW